MKNVPIIRYPSLCSHFIPHTLFVRQEHALGVLFSYRQAKCSSLLLTTPVSRTGLAAKEYHSTPFKLSN